MVLISEVGSPEKVPVPVDKDGLLPRQVLDLYFPGTVGLYYEENEGKKIPVKFDESITKLLPPDGGWDCKEFYVVRPSSRPTTPAATEDSPIPSRKAKMTDESFNTPSDLNEKQKEYIERLRKFMFYSILTKTEAGAFENISTIRSCVTVAKKEIALMAAHCLPFGVPEGFVFEIYSQENQPHLVEVKYINRKFDFVVLKTVNKGFDECPIGLAYPDVGTEYAVLGYHGYNSQSSHCLSGFFGRIRNNEHSPDLQFVIGSPGTTRGCSGAGAFTLLKLIGIVVSGRVPPQNVYSSSGSLADHVAEACIELAEPSYSHIVPSSTIFALFDLYSDLRS